ncbi:MAG: dockerin type I domain-containing protein, partial [Anaerolineae bacterium]
DPAAWQWIETWRRFYAQGDLTGNGLTDVVDVQSVAVHWGETAAQPIFDRWYDLDGDGAVTLADVAIVAGQWDGG